MASRFAQQKPDPAIQRNISRARRRTQRGGKAQAFVVTASLAATLLGWALFAQEDAQSAAVQAATSSQSVITPASQSSDSTATPTVSGGIR